jgi:hypothetical protein
MSVPIEGKTGASRPPRCFGAALVVAAALSAVAAQAEPAEPSPAGPGDPAECQYVRGGGTRIEGFDGADTFGVQLIVKDGRWVWQRAPSGVLALCPSCADHEISKGVFRFGRAPFLSPVQDGDLRGETGQRDAGSMEFALHPRAIAMALWKITTVLPSKVDTLTEIEPVELWGVQGRARVVAVTSAGRTAPGVAFALEDRCFAMFGAFLRKDEGEVSIGDLLKTGGSLGILKYRPVPHELSPAIHFPLGDARKRWEDDLK